MNARELAAKVVASVDMDRTSAQYNMQPFNTQMTYYRHIISAIDTATAELRAECERMRRIVEVDNAALHVLVDAPELNMSNYDEDQVCWLNQAVIEAVLSMRGVRYSVQEVADQARAK